MVPHRRRRHGMPAAPAAAWIMALAVALHLGASSAYESKP